MEGLNSYITIRGIRKQRFIPVIKNRRETECREVKAKKKTKKREIEERREAITEKMGKE